MRAGCRIDVLANFVSEKYDRVRFHGTEAKFIQLQAESIGIELVQSKTGDDDYEEKFKQTIRNLLPRQIKGVIFGDIYFDEHREWAERICKEIGIKAVEPLWAKSTEQVINDFFSAGFRAVIVSAQADLIDKKWIGSELDHSFIDYLKAKDIDICGEAGQYHTAVIDGPIFSRPIEIVKAKTVKINNHWFLDTCEYRLSER
jgi:uncharacterized protein (TIGR00290 family)